MANALTLSQLARRLKFSRLKSAAAVARMLDISEPDLLAVTLRRERYLFGSRCALTTTVWVCPQCIAQGTVDALRGKYIQFLCLRCGTYLLRQEDAFFSGASPHPATAAVRAFQDEIIDISSHHSPMVRRDCLDQLVRHIGRRAIATGEGRKPNGALEPENLGAHHALPRIQEGIEDPRLMSDVLRLAWYPSATREVTNLLSNALGFEAAPPKLLKPFAHVPPRTAATFMAGGRMTLDQVISGLREVHVRLDEGGLRAGQVPVDVRYARDAFLLSDMEYRWRLTVCEELYRWLALSQTARRSRDEVRVTSEPARFGIVVPLNLTDVQRNCTVLLSHMLRLAQELVAAGPPATKSRSAEVAITEWELRKLASGALSRRPRRAPEVAAYWMWLDSIQGTDAYGRLPTCAPSEVRKFQDLLSPDDRGALRSYRRKIAGDNEIRKS